MQMQMLKTTLTLTMYNPTITSYYHILNTTTFQRLHSLALEAMLGRFDNDDDDDTITYTNVCSFVDTDIDNDEEGQSMDYTITTKWRRNDDPTTAMAQLAWKPAIAVVFTGRKLIDPGVQHGRGNPCVCFKFIKETTQWAGWSKTN